MARSQRHVRYTMGFDSTESDRYPGNGYGFDWAGTWPSGSGGRYIANGFKPDIVLDWARGKFIGADSSLNAESDFVAHARASGGTVVDSDGLVKWGAHNLALWSEDLAKQIAVNENIGESPK